MQNWEKLGILMGTQRKGKNILLRFESEEKAKDFMGWCNEEVTEGLEGG